MLCVCVVCVGVFCVWIYDRNLCKLLDSQKQMGKQAKHEKRREEMYICSEEV